MLCNILNKSYYNTTVVQTIEQIKTKFNNALSKRLYIIIVIRIYVYTTFTVALMKILNSFIMTIHNHCHHLNSKFGYTTTMENFINIQNTICIQHYQNFINTKNILERLRVNASSNTYFARQKLRCKKSNNVSLICAHITLISNNSGYAYIISSKTTAQK